MSDPQDMEHHQSYVLRTIEAGLGNPGDGTDAPVSAAEAAWVATRLAELLGWAH